MLPRGNESCAQVYRGNLILSQEDNRQELIGDILLKSSTIPENGQSGIMSIANRPSKSREASRHRYIQVRRPSNVERESPLAGAVCW
ncbi:hypothetical protein AVEN_267531-1 [Araneus ventricosus]|uniref:Uncharacterized protein n=1 Tax=Araneus ventricosus TaxID=182803 RepID=A0A4Y2TXQ3_ARAVE|nr:hypothetical protein AVEN_267531-1 [Araneus ventricosus]